LGRSLHRISYLLGKPERGAEEGPLSSSFPSPVPYGSVDAGLSQLQIPINLAWLNRCVVRTIREPSVDVSLTLSCQHEVHPTSSAATRVSIIVSLMASV
jgi:hypothetical protein